MYYNNDNVIKIIEKRGLKIESRKIKFCQTDFHKVGVAQYVLNTTKKIV